MNRIGRNPYTVGAYHSKVTNSNIKHAGTHTHKRVMLFNQKSVRIANKHIHYSSKSNYIVSSASTK